MCRVRFAPGVTVRLYSIALSHPARAARLMLRHKGIEHELVDVPPGAQRVMLRLHGFRRGTVPALMIDGRRIQGSLNVSRALDELRPNPPLFPADPRARAAVEEAERWGDAELQPVPRHLFRWALSRDRRFRRSFAETIGLPLAPVAAEVMKPVSMYFARVVSETSDESIRSELAALRDQIDHVDELIAGGVIGEDEPNAADFQIATCVRVLMSFPQLRPLIEARPAGELAMRIAPRFGRPLPVEFPPEWIPRAGSAVGP
jgi:glutathione S-transferase